MSEQASISFSAQPVVPTKNFVIALYLESDLSTVLQVVIPPKAGSVPYYTNPFTAMFTGLNNNLMYRCVLWESVTTDPAGIQRTYMDFVPNGQSIVLRDDLHIYGGDTGADINQPTYVDTSLVGWNYSLEEASTGTIDPTNRPVYTINSGGGWTLTNGENIQQDQHFTMRFQPQVSNVNTSNPSLISSGQIITATTTIDNTYINQDLYLRGTASNFVITLPSLATIGNYQQLIFKSDGGIHKCVRIQCAGSDMIQRFVPVSKIVLGKDEKLVLFKANGVWNVDNDLINLDRVGEMFWSDQENVKNTLSFNAQQVNTADYERLTDFVNANPNAVVTQFLWNTNTDSNGNYISQGKYAITGTVLQLPDASNMGVLKAINNTTGRNPGDFQDFQMLAHQHEQTVAQLPTSVFGRGIVARLLGKYNGTQSQVADLTSAPTDITTAAQIARQGNEVLIKNRASFLLVRC